MARGHCNAGVRPLAARCPGKGTEHPLLCCLWSQRSPSHPISPFLHKKCTLIQRKAPSPRHVHLIPEPLFPIFPSPRNERHLLWQEEETWTFWG